MIMNLQFIIENLLTMIVIFLRYTFLRRALLNQSKVVKTETMKNTIPHEYSGSNSTVTGPAIDGKCLFFDKSCQTLTKLDKN